MEFWILISIAAVVLAWGVVFLSEHFSKGALLLATAISVTPTVMGYFYLPIIPVSLALLMAWGHSLFKAATKRVLSVTLTSASILFLLVAGALIYALPMFPIHKPSGKYNVGTQALVISETLPAQIWYPTEATTNSAPYILEGTPVINEIAKVFGLPDFALAHFQWITTPANLNAPISTDEATFPVLLFSHGLGGFKAQNTFQVIELASHGYVIIAIDHPGYAAATVLGERVLTNRHADLLGAEAHVLDNHVGDWVNNLQTVLDSLPTINQRFDNRLDETKIGAFGHSFGGATAYQLLLVDARVQAAVNMDGGAFGIIRPTHKPFFYLNASSTLDFEAFSKQLDEFSDEEVVRLSGSTKEAVRQNFRELLTRREKILQANAYSLVIPNMQHLGFTDAVLYSPLLADVTHRHPVINDFTLAFFNQYLKGKTDISMTDLSNRYSDMKFQAHTAQP